MGVSFLFLLIFIAMQPHQNEEKDLGFLFSLNLMVLGGSLLLFFIISANKLSNHYFADSLNHSRGILYSVNVLEAESFDIRSEGELYLVWISFALSFIGLVIVIYKLAKTWSH